jgi:ABC-type antimicrobial peptide transport system permease subunit
MARRYARIGFVAVVWLFVACAVGQVFLAGLGVFGLPPGDFTAHRDWGYTFGYLTLVILILALVGRLSRRMIGLSALLLVLFALQSILVAVRGDYPSLAALHPLNGFLILLVAIVLGRDGWRQVRSDRADATVEG